MFVSIEHLAADILDTAVKHGFTSFGLQTVSEKLKAHLAAVGAIEAAAAAKGADIAADVTAAQAVAAVVADDVETAKAVATAVKAAKKA